MKDSAQTIPVIGLGGGGHARVVIEILRADAAYEIMGLLDSNRELQGQTILGVPILGDDSRLPELVKQGISHFFIGLGGVSSNAPRRRLFEFALQHGLQPVSAIHQRAIISPSARLDAGVTIMAGAIVNACARLATNVIINSGAIIEHDCIVQDHAHVATGARLAGEVHVGSGAHIGLGACVRQSLRVGRGAVVGAGAVVIEDVPEATVVVGVPARHLRKVIEQY